MFNLLVYNKKIATLEQLKKNFDFDSVRMYLLGGSLSRWLILCGESEIAEKVKKIDLSQSPWEIDVKLADIFKQPIPKKSKEYLLKKEKWVNNANNSIYDYLNQAKNMLSQSAVYKNEIKLNSFILKENSFQNLQYGSFSGSFNSFSSFNNSSSFEIGTGSFNVNQSSNYLSSSNSFLNLNTIGSFNLQTSFSSSFSNLSSFNAFKYEYEFEQGSFSNSSFNIGNFNISSFNNGSFGFEINIGSFYEGSFITRLVNMANSDSFSEKTITVCDLSSVQNSDNKEQNSNESINTESNITKCDENKSQEEKIYDNLLLCPLNRFGYGIHII